MHKKMEIFLAHCQLGVSLALLTLDLTDIIATASRLNSIDYSYRALLLATAIKGLFIGVYMWIARNSIKTIKDDKGRD